MGITLTDEWYRQNVAQTSRSKKKKGRKMKRNKKSTKHYPVQRKITMGVELPAQAHTNFLIRTDKLLSNVNHRLYRQSRVYNVKVDIDTDLADGSTVQVYALADTWYNMKAYQLAKKMFDENSAEELAQLGSARARWNDFRVDHGDSSVQIELDALQYDGGTASTRFVGGEYLVSEVADATGASKLFRWSGTSATSFNIIDEYDTTGNTNPDPAFPIGGNVAYDGLTDEVDDNQMDHLSADGNSPPYDQGTIENQCWVLIGTLYIRATGTNKLSTGYFDAPCGLIRLVTSGGLEANSLSENVSIEVKGGDYKGVHAPSYLE